MKARKLLSGAIAMASVVAGLSASADEFAWKGGTGDNKWCTPGNWYKYDGGEYKPSQEVPSAASQIYTQDAAFGAVDIELDADAEVAGWITYSWADPYRRLSGGHTLTINGSGQDDPFSSVGTMEISGSGTGICFLVPANADYNYDILNSALVVTNGATARFEKAPVLGKDGKIQVLGGSTVRVVTRHVRDVGRH